MLWVQGFSVVSKMCISYLENNEVFKYGCMQNFCMLCLQLFFNFVDWGFQLYYIRIKEFLIFSRMIIFVKIVINKVIMLRYMFNV